MEQSGMQQQQGTDELPQATKGANGAGENTTNYNTPTTKEPLSDPMQHLIITPLHCICTICQGDKYKSQHATFTISQKAVREHYKKEHDDKFVLGKFKKLGLVYQSGAKVRLFCKSEIWVRKSLIRAT